MKYYDDNTGGEFNISGINQCYIRMVKSIFIIEELEYKNRIMMPEGN